MEYLEQVLTFPEPYIWKIHSPHLLSVVIIWFLPSKQKEIEYANNRPSNSAAVQGGQLELELL